MAKHRVLKKGSNMIRDNRDASYYFHQGTNFWAYEYLGCSSEKTNDGFLYCFRTWAPNAHSVELVCDRTGWTDGLALQRVTDNGVWELKLETSDSLEGMLYKFRITSNSGVKLKGDPYARYSKGSDDGASVVFTSNSFRWKDSTWLKRRAAKMKSENGSYLPVPINIYEVHLGSFLRKDSDNSYLNYRELADTLSMHVKQMGYTHVELLPIMEHPFDGSWGYQVCAFYAPTSRFGDPNDFRYFINKMHEEGIGVILDWVPAHFPKDEWGLYEFDGSPLYEYQGRDRQESRSWGTRFFDLGREEIQSFLISNALYYLREFHVDGLRVDAVASMLYLDYDREPGEWVPNKDGGNLNLEATAFFQKLNTQIFAEFPDVLMIAEESTSYGLITHPVSSGGLGFNMKWNMGWANDFYKYISTDPLYRKYNHTALNFPIMYAFRENYCLPISHDEVVHGKLSFIDKMYGSYEDKFRQMRASLLYMMTFPGKKLMFMGTEYAQFREWDYDNSLEWFMTDYPAHTNMLLYVRALNQFYLTHDALWYTDFDAGGFEWILSDEADKNSIAYKRVSKKGSTLIAVINFSGAEQELKLPLPDTRKLTTLFESELGALLDSPKISSEQGVRTATVKLSPFSGVVFRDEKNKKIIKI